MQSSPALLDRRVIGRAQEHRPAFPPGALRRSFPWLATGISYRGGSECRRNSAHGNLPRQVHASLDFSYNELAACRTAATPSPTLMPAKILGENAPMTTDFAALVETTDPAVYEIHTHAAGPS